MDSTLNLIRQSIQREYRRLLDEDGLTPGMLADIMTYDSRDMIYQITNPHTTTIPPLDKHLFGAKRLSEQGNIRISRLSFCAQWRHHRAGKTITNGCHLDEHRDMDRVQEEYDRALEAEDYERCEHSVQKMKRIVKRYEDELAQKKGQQTQHAANGTS